MRCRITAPPSQSRHAGGSWIWTATGRLGRLRDAQGYGDFTGQRGAGGAVAAAHRGRHRSQRDAVARPAGQPDARGRPCGRAAAVPASSGTWRCDTRRAAAPAGACAATPPAFEPIAASARNHDEVTFWLTHLPDAPFAILGNLNVDPQDGDGDPATLAALAEGHAGQPAPRGAWQPPRTDRMPGRRGDPALDTAEYDRAPGNLRLDYVLPAQGLSVLASGVVWPAPEDPLAEAVATGVAPAWLVWVDLDLDDDGGRPGRVQVAAVTQ